MWCESLVNMIYDNMYQCNMNKSISSFTKESKNFATLNNRIIIEQSANCMRSQHKYSARSVSFHCKVSENSHVHICAGNYESGSSEKSKELSLLLILYCIHLNNH